MKKYILFIFLLIFVFSVNSYAQSKVGQTGAKFLDVGIGARACGMGEAYTVLGQDANALFYNPSCIAEIDGRIDLAVNVTQWIADIQYVSMAFVYNADVWGTFGFHILTPDYGTIPWTIVDESAEAGFVDLGEVRTDVFCAGIAYAREFTDKFTVGLQTKYVSIMLGENFDLATETSQENKVTQLAWDFGLIFYPGFKSFAFGMSVRNFCPRVTFEQIGFEFPLTFALGVGLDVMDFLGDVPDMSLNIGAEMLHPRDWQEEFNLGAEFSYMDLIFLRAGYKFRYAIEGLNAGMGVNLGGAKIDYSYSQMKYFDMVNRVSVGFSF